MDAIEKAIDEFEAALAELKEHAEIVLGLPSTVTEPYIARLRAARSPEVTDEALEEHLRWIREGHECNDPDCHICEAAYHIRILFAAAKQGEGKP